MHALEEFIQNNELRTTEDIDFLLEAADLARQLIGERKYSDINTLINFTIDKNYFEAFSWVLDILQEEYGKGEGTGLEDFGCSIGYSVSNYDEFAKRLEIGYNVIKRDVEKEYDECGEEKAFFNICTYETKYKNIFLVSSENFDTKDNDFIHYRLLFTKQRIFVGG